MGRQPGVDPGGIGDKGLDRLPIQVADLLLGQAVDAEGTHEAVRGQAPRPQDLGQASGAEAAHGLHLP